MHRKFLKLLRCPDSGEPLFIRNESSGNNGFIESGELYTESGKSYPIINGIPRFVTSEKYSKSFGYEWNKWPRVQFESDNERKVMQGYTTSMWNKITELNFDFEGKLFIEFGCGPGRFLQIVRKRNGIVVGLDMSSAVEAARNNFPNDPDVFIVQGDILSPPFNDSTFDVGYSIGVLHHTPDPRKGLTNLARVTKAGGNVICAVYPEGGFYSFNSVRRFRKVHNTIVPILGNYPAIIYSFFSAFILSPIFNGLKKFKFLYRYVRYIEKNLLVLVYLPDAKWAYLDIFDAITPAIASTHSFAEVNEWFQEAGCEEVHRTAWSKTSLTGKKK